MFLWDISYEQIENNLDEWVTGEHVDVLFSANAYKKKYHSHLKRLTDFDEKTCNADIIPRLCMHLLKMAQCIRLSCLG